MSRKRLSKKQLKSDRFVERTFDWAHWVETHRTQAIGALALVALLAVGFFVWRQMSRSADEEAAFDYLRARQAHLAGNWQLAVSDLQGFLARHGSSSYADDAQLFLGDAYYQAGQYPQAAQALEAFLNEHGDSPLADNARRLLAAAYQQQGQFARAISIYQEALDEAESDERKIVFREELARIYRSQDDMDAAANQYRAIIDLDPEGEKAREARRELAELTATPIGVAGAEPAPTDTTASPPLSRPQREPSGTAQGGGR